MAAEHIVILGAGAAGAAAARGLNAAEGIEVDLVGLSREKPYNRTLVNKGVATGLLEPGQARLPQPDVPLVADTARVVDVQAQTVELESGATMDFDALIVATGSTPRRLAPELTGLNAAVKSQRVTTLHSMEDAVRVHNVLVRSPHPARIILLGAGLVAAETSSLLSQAGHDVVIVSGSTHPGRTALGPIAADRIAELHHTQVSMYLGRTAREIAVVEDHVELILDDHTRLDADLIIVALGTVPAAPAPWNGAVETDDHLRVIGAPQVYAAGGVAVHHHPSLGSYRIDHWAEAAAQGTHAALTVLHDLGKAPDPGAYLPRSAFSVRLYDQTLTGVGHTGPTTSTRVVSKNPLSIVHTRAGIPVGALGLESGRFVRDWIPYLHVHT